MENLDFKITEQDIRNYLVKHQNDTAIKNKEAMFVKYMKESKKITQESLEILMKKYNWEERKIDGTYSVYDGRGYSKQEELASFSNYLASIHNLDISGICHIMIPVLSYYNGRTGFHNYRCHQELSNICTKINITASYQDIDNAIIDMKENYLLGFGDDHVYCYAYDTYFKFSIDKSKKLIQEYSHIYGEEPVKKIRKIVRERM